MKGHYANYFEIGHNVFEFVLDFGQFYPDSQPPVMHSRVIVGPAYAKRLLEVLLKAVDSYEQRFGQIADEDAAVAAAIEGHETPLGEAAGDADSTLPSAKPNTQEGHDDS